MRIDKITEEYKISVGINSDTQKIFNALTKHIDKWWGTFDGSAENIGDEFEVSFDKDSYWGFRIIELIPNEKVVWKCNESHQDHHVKGMDKEWLNSTLHWKLIEENENTFIDFYHEGLYTTNACYDVCSSGWNFYIATSLKEFLETGKGQPLVG